MVNPQWLRSFLVLAEVGNFTRVAERLGMTQAAVSQHIRQLEIALGPLVIRRPRRLELTPAGHALLAYGADMRRADEALKLRLADAESMAGEVGIVTPGSVGLSIYPTLLAIQKATPGLVVRHRFAPDTDVLDAVLQGDYELGLVSRKPDDARLEASLFSREALELVVPVGETAKTWADLERLGFIDHPDGQAMATRLFARRFPANPGVQALPVHGFINQIGLILEPVANGLGFTVMPQYARLAFARPDAIEVHECGPPVVDSLWLIHRAEWPLPKRAAYVIGQLRQRLP